MKTITARARTLSIIYFLRDIATRRGRIEIGKRGLTTNGGWSYFSPMYLFVYIHTQIALTKIAGFSGDNFALYCLL